MKHRSRFRQCFCWNSSRSGPSFILGQRWGSHTTASLRQEKQYIYIYIYILKIYLSPQQAVPALRSSARVSLECSAVDGCHDKDPGPREGTLELQASPKDAQGRPGRRGSGWPGDDDPEALSRMFGARAVSRSPTGKTVPSAAEGSQRLLGKVRLTASNVQGS